MALATVGGSALAAVATFLLLRHAGAADDRHVRFVWHAWRWLSLDSTNVEVTFSADNLSAVMLLVVTGVGFLIHVYATGYMAKDPGFHRFFAYLNLFIFSMLVLVLGDSLPILFVGWEGVGLCSYLLIGFWFDEAKNAAAGSKAFIVNRIGDFGLLVAMAMILHYSGTLSWQGMEAQSGQLLTRVQIWPIGAGLPTWLPEFLTQPRQVNAATVVGLMLMLGCAGKSAQIPLYVWLPDAMAGPTPVSALIHAATMVTAGVYLVARMNYVFLLSPTTMAVVAVIGALTALFAATIGIVQNDIKKVLAYSTVSQLGFMFMAVGVGAFASGIFHLVTHAFFKAALFLCAGCVIHAMHARIHDSDASQDMRNMGGMRAFMPRTFFAYTAATFAIVGFPLTSGFFSKDEILFRSLVNRIEPSADLKAMVLRSAPRDITADQRELLLTGLSSWSWLGKALFVIGLLAAVMTAFYMFRSWLLTFFGEFRGWKVVAPATARPGPDVAGSELGDGHELVGHGHEHGHEHGQEHEHEHGHGHAGEPLRGPAPHEAPPSMTWPIMILAVLALVAGFLNAGALHLPPIFEHWLAPLFARTAALVTTAQTGDALHTVEYYAMAAGTLAFLAGAGTAWWVYRMKAGEPARQAALAAPKLHALVLDKWRIDELYRATIIGFMESLAETAVWFDKWVVDGIIARLTAGVVALAGAVFRIFQTGKVQTYGTVMVAGTVAVAAYMLWPQAKSVVKLDPKSGNYVVHASPGIGYRYRWDVDGDGQWDYGDSWTLRTAADVKGANAPEPGESRTVRLQVRNAFGLTNTEVIHLNRPKVDKSVPERPRLDKGVTP
jgi:NADH-quinone oxidoreductase subunit L